MMESNREDIRMSAKAVEKTDFPICIFRPYVESVPILRLRSGDVTVSRSMVPIRSPGENRERSA